MQQLKTQVDKTFLDLFTNDICNYQFGEEIARLNLHILRIDSNRFTYLDLIDVLSNAVNTYCLSRTRYESYCNSAKFGEMHREAVKKLRTYKSNDGETGELLLYCFLETHLKAPKILTKLELKMHSDDYVKGTDGVHLLEIEKGNYQLVFGESKLNANLTTSLSEAFKAIHDFITRGENNLHDEINLICDHLLKEVVDDNLYHYLLNIIKPKTSVGITKNDAFGIFAGFNIEISEEELKLENKVFNTVIRQRIVTEVQGKYEHIRKKIKEYKLFGYHFYLYVFPFTDKVKISKEIMRNLEMLGKDA